MKPVFGIILLALAISAVANADTLSVTSPTSSSTVGSPVQYMAKATTTCTKGMKSMGVYTAPSHLAYSVAGGSLDTKLSLSAGTYNTTVVSVDNCGGSVQKGITITVNSALTLMETSHVFIVVEENHSYSSVIGSSSMPYLNGLAKKYGLATKYYANTHPSIGNYFMLTTGQIITNNDSFCTTITNDNIVRHLLTAGKTWKSYAEGLPWVGYTGCGQAYYVKRHNPLAYFSDVANSTNERLNLVPFTQFATDLKNNALPNFSFIVPNLLDDAHNGSLSQADTWLQNKIGPLVASATFQNSGVLIILFDEKRHFRYSGRRWTRCSGRHRAQGQASI